MASEVIYWRVDEKIKRRLQASAKKRKQSLTDLVKEASEFFAEVDPSFWEMLEYLEARTHVHKAIICQNLTLDYAAKVIAKEVVYGETVLHEVQLKLTTEFRWSPRGIVTGKQLLNSLIEEHVLEFEDEREKILLHKESYGVPLDEGQQEFLTKRKAEGQAELKRQLDRQEEIEARIELINEFKAKGLIPAGAKNYPSLAHECRELQAGNITVETFKSHVEGILKEYKDPAFE